MISDIRHDLVGSSPAVQNLLEFIRKASPTDATVLVQGQSGTGKEHVARALHANSRRSSGPFVAVNCAALSEALLESELFGHEKGAFTGAVAQRQGRFEQADGGTLFLDEVGELAPAIQAKLLRALETREIDRVGGRRPISVDIRLIAATNRNLETAVAAREFREDLYYRLKVLSVRTPTLAERREDIPMLARHFVTRYSRTVGTKTDISPEALKLLEGYSWPGNVRELQNAIEYAVVLGDGDVLKPSDFPQEIARGKLTALARTAGSSADRELSYQDAITATKRRLLETAFARSGGDYKEAARLLGLHPKAVHRCLKTLDLGYLLKG